MDLCEDIDELNDETFGGAEDGDWELEHERFALAQSHDCMAPDADQLPKFWEASDDVSFLWQPETLDNYKGFLDDEGRERGVNVEETLQKLVSEDDAFEDPAILDISKKVSQHKLSASALDKLLGVPAFPAGPGNLLSSKDIWSSGEVSTNRYQSVTHLEKDTSSNSPPSLMELLRQVAQAKAIPKHRTIGLSNVSSHITQPNTAKPGSIANSPMSNVRNFNPAEIVGIIREGNREVDPDIAQQSMSINSTSQGSSPWRHQPNRPLSQLSNQLVTKQQVDALRLQSLMDTRNSTANALTPLVKYGQNNPALGMLLMQSQTKRPTSDTTARLPDPRYFQFVPPPSVPTPVPGPLFGVQRFVGSGHMTQAVNPLFPGSLNSPTPAPFFAQSTSCLRFAPPKVLLVRPLSGTLAPGPGHQLQGLSRDDRLSDKFGIPVASDEADFDPNQGSWMSDLESVNALLVRLRPLMVANPYVQDYYFAINWLRRMYSIRNKRISSGQITGMQPTPVMLMPSPLTVDSLSDPTHYQHTAHQFKFVLPLTVLPDLINSLKPIESGTHESEAHSQEGTDTGIDMASNKKSYTDDSSALGRPTKSSILRPRVIAELSLVSALLSDAVVENQRTTKHSTDGDAVCGITRGLRNSRLRLLVLSRIERMYSLLLNMDEVDIALERVVVQNATRSRFTQHRLELIQSLIQLLCTTSVQLSSDRPCNTTLVLGDIQSLKSPVVELFSVRKGIRLFASLLRCLPQDVLRALIRLFISDYSYFRAISGNQIDEFASLLYSSMRNIVYEIVDINEFIISCFPDVINPVESTKDRVHSLVQSKLGLSLICCLLDVCARLSKPDDPSNFVRFGTYFSLATFNLSEINSPLESFPHLASILPVYVRPESHPSLTSSCIDQFCRLIDPVVVPSDIPLANGSKTLDEAPTSLNVQSNGTPEMNPSIPLTKSVDDPDYTERTTMIYT